MESHLLFHVMNYKNLPSVLRSGGLFAYSQIEKQNVNYTNIAHQGLQERRSTTEIPIEPYGNLHDYVPFYFAPRSPMLYAIKQGRVDGYAGNQSEIIYLVTRTNIIEDAGLPFVFTDGHAIMFITDFYNDLNNLDRIDWHIMRQKYWNDTEEDLDRKRRRQAEFLVKKFVDLDKLVGIGVRDEWMKQIVEEILSEHGVNLQVLVKPNYYF